MSVSWELTTDQVWLATNQPSLGALTSPAAAASVSKRVQMFSYTAGAGLATCAVSHEKTPHCPLGPSPPISGPRALI